MGVSSFKEYDADQMLIVFGMIPISSGWADGSFVRIESTEDDFKTVVGTDGSVTRSRTNDRRATVTFRLMQSADANAQLSALRIVDLTTNNGGGVVPLLIKDKGGTSLYTAAKAWIRKRPDADFDRTAKEREWTIEVANLVALDGGN